MDESLLALLMYLDEGLVTNLSSLVLSGYINIRTTKLIQDRTFSGNAVVEKRLHNFDEDRCGEDERDGFKSSNLASYKHSEDTNHQRGSIENRQFIRREEEFQRIFTSFSLHRQVISELETGNSIKFFDNTTINEGDLVEGEYVKMKGHLTTESINSYLDSLLTVFDCFGCDCLNKMIPSAKMGIFNYDSMKNFISHLNTILNKNSTQDLILQCGDTPVVLNVNNNFFMNNNSYVYDKIDCPCTVYGKVIRVAGDGQCVSLLRKTAQHDYYANLLNSCSPYYDMLSSNGIIIPKMPRLKCEGISLIVVPISICM